MNMLVPILQAVSGLLWLLPAIYLTPRIIASWRHGPSRTTMLSAPLAWLSWLMVGFSVRWLAWPHSVSLMHGIELVAWGSLYALSGFLAVWFFIGARQTKDD